MEMRPEAKVAMVDVLQRHEDALRLTQALALTTDTAESREAAQLAELAAHKAVLDAADRYMPGFSYGTRDAINEIRSEVDKARVVESGTFPRPDTVS